MAKDRYWNMWAIANDGTILWQITGKEMKVDLGHFPAIGDIDGDGLDEVFITNTLIDSDGTILWQIPDICAHHDAAYILENVPERRIVTVADKLRLITPDGQIVWEKDGGHLQYVHVGRFSTDSGYGPYQFLVQDYVPGAANYHEGCKGYNAQANSQRATLFDWYGNQIWSEETPDRPLFRAINWLGHCDSILRDGCNGKLDILDIHGNVIDTVAFVRPDGKPVEKELNCCAADILGDSRDELILFDETTVNIYTNTAVYNPRRLHNGLSLYQSPITR